MPDKTTHALIGIAIGAVGAATWYLKECRESKQLATLSECVGYGLIGAAVAGSAALLPDLLEPAITNPNHRGSFHSIAFLIALAAGNLVLYQLSSVKQEMKLLALTGSAGYISHLLADARTQKGLPWSS